MNVVIKVNDEIKQKMIEYYKDKRIQEYLIFVLGTVYSEPIKAGYYYDKYNKTMYF